MTSAPASRRRYTGYQTSSSWYCCSTSTATRFPSSSDMVYLQKSDDMEETREPIVTCKTVRSHGPQRKNEGVQCKLQLGLISPSWRNQSMVAFMPCSKLQRGL